jgi:hypothetical protein
MKHSYYYIPIFLCAVIFLLYVSPVSGEEGYDVFTYNDPDNLLLWTRTSFNDGKILLNFVKPASDTDTCFKPIFYYRIVHLNGTIVPLTIEISNIEEFNFCSGIYEFPYFNMHTLTPDYFLITYLESQQIGDVTYYQRVGSLINLYGDIVNKINITEPLNFQSNTQLTKNINPEEGFLVTNIVSRENAQEWISFKAP